MRGAVDHMKPLIPSRLRAPALSAAFTTGQATVPLAERGLAVTAVELGAALAESGFIVCSGGYGGVMEAVSRGAQGQ